RGASLFGQARTVADWVAGAAALGGVNGGFFGRALDDGRKQLLGVFVRHGRALAAVPLLKSSRSGDWYARSSFGLTPDGTPSICWATAPSAGEPPRRYRLPEVRATDGEVWRVRDAVGCGPRLIQSGKRLVTDRRERLVSEGALPRTFLGFSREDGAPRYLVLATASAMSFESCARFLKEYFRRFHGAACAEAMALDGGASTQMAYRAGDQVV